jgi:tetratricopeptide (TPR) repeat protein
MRAFVALLLHLATAPLLLAVVPRLTYERVVPAAHDLGRGDIALVHAIGDTDKIEAFVEHFLYQTNHSGFHRVRDARNTTGAADRFLAVKSFSCRIFDREGEGSTRDLEGNRVKRKHFWADAVCSARIDVMGPDMKRLSTFYGRGEGTSPRNETLTADDRAIALQQAARYTAVDAAERITPRRVREFLPLDDTAPGFEEGMSLIEANRLAETRALWEAALRKDPRSAGLRFNLAAVCEALGDRVAARRHYAAATEMAPKEDRYASAMRAFERRQ